MQTPLLGRWAAALVLCALLPTPVCPASTPSDPSPPPPSALAPSHKAARRNAPQIFNALHSAVRQWGSSLDHNGMSFFLATVPEGSTFFHGAPSTDRPRGLEWLAFEVEHAQVFSRSEDPNEQWNSAGTKKQGAQEAGQDLLRFEGHGSKSLESLEMLPSTSRQEQHPMPLAGSRAVGASSGRGGRRPFKPRRGYLQTYRASRPLNLLYIDGMAAGKCPYGPLDTQDYVLLDWDINEPPRGGEKGWRDELARANQLCDVVAKGWGEKGTPVDGFVRMEAGFEIIYCHFEEGGGLERVAVDASPFMNETGWVDWEYSFFEWLHASSLRYNGLPAERITVDWSSMVSAFFYDLNLTNPDPKRPELPRVLNTTRWERQALKQRVDDVVGERHPSKAPGSGINWRAAVDAIVSRYSDRLAALASRALSADESRRVVNFLLSPFADATGSSILPSLDRCRSVYLGTALARNGSWTAQDELIHTAVDAVSGRICQVLIEAWVALAENDEEEESGQDAKAAALVAGWASNLVGQLGWSSWRECRGCAADEICFVAMFPAGTAEDHYAPRCKNATELWRGQSRAPNYWWGPESPFGDPSEGEDGVDAI